jgi:hypothetical protein
MVVIITNFTGRFQLNYLMIITMVAPLNNIYLYIKNFMNRFSVTILKKL